MFIIIRYLQNDIFKFWFFSIVHTKTKILHILKLKFMFSRYTDLTFRKYIRFFRFLLASWIQFHL